MGVSSQDVWVDYQMVEQEGRERLQAESRTEVKARRIRHIQMKAGGVVFSQSQELRKLFRRDGLGRRLKVEVNDGPEIFWTHAPERPEHVHF